MITNTSITIYNKYFVNRKEAWARTFIDHHPGTGDGVKWENRKAANNAKGLQAADRVTVYMPMRNAAQYVKPMTWRALVVKSGSFTFQVGDFIVKGEATQEITEEFTISRLKESYDDVAHITAIDTNDVGSTTVRHFQLSAA